MATKVGPKGQVVIEKTIRDQLGIEPGALAIQRVVDDHVEMWFAPPIHNRSLKGVLKPFIKRSIPVDEWDSAREEAWDEAVRDFEDEQ